MRRALPFVLLCLALGLVLNVGVAWYFGIRGAEWMSIGIDSRDPVADWPTAPPPELARFKQVHVATTRSAIETTIGAGMLESTQPQSAAEMMRHEFGWPFRSLAWTTSVPYGPFRRIFGASSQPVPAEVSRLARGLSLEELPVEWRAWLRRQRTEGEQRIPLDPVWTGLAFNTLLFAALPILARYGFIAIRRWRRTLTGKCPACAYDLHATPKSAPCPECGRLARPNSSDHVA